MTKRTLLYGLLLALLGQPAGAELLIGQVAPFTGPSADIGKELSLGTQVCLAAVNAADGVHGEKLRLVTLDDRGDEAETLRHTRQLLDSEVIALTGFVGTPNVRQLLKKKLLSRANVALVGVFSGSEDLRFPFNENIFHVRSGHIEEAERIVQQLQSLGISRIAVFYHPDEFGTAGLSGIETAMKRRRLQPVAYAAYDEAKNSAEPAVAAIRKANPQAVVMIAESVAAADFLQRYLQPGSFTQLFSSSTVNIPQLVAKVGGDRLHGVAVAQSVPNVRDMTLPVVREYLDALKKYGPKGANPSPLGLEGCINAKVLVAGIRRSGSKITRDSVLRGLEKLSAHDVGGYTVEFNPTSRIGSKYVDLTVFGRNGQLLR